MLRRLIGRYWEGEDRRPAFLKTGHTDENFHKVGKYFSLRQRLKSLAKIGESSGERCLRTITGILSGPVALFVSRFLMQRATSPMETRKLQSRDSVREEGLEEDGHDHPR